MDIRVNLGELNTPQDIERLASIISEMADSLDTLYSTTTPNGNISGRQGQVCLYNNSGTYTTWINTTGSTVWQQIDAVVGMQYSDTRSKVVTFTRDISLTTDLAITGVGFKPTALIVFGVINTSYVITWGFSAQDKTAGGINNYLGTDPRTWGIHSDLGANKVIAAWEVSGGNTYFTMSVSTYDDDGFTLTCAKNGLPVGTLTVFVLALR
jgi:hypothetical protein